MILNFLKKVFPAKNNESLIIELDSTGLSDQIYNSCDLTTLEERIFDVLRSGNYGIYDGNEIRDNKTMLYFYAVDAELLYSALKNVLTGYQLCENAKVNIKTAHGNRVEILSKSNE